ncbi:hypothetical protein [Methylobacterium haplocladii]|uniref:Uncharacterized protein n=1 Tax=Methylobacterium haplocladii TaxID=1176176 RepID=A0A512ISB5_9HYPH|nr:hypothetical protein [Methylobacterium haplocladii]GEP00602.1 hypothetical protein MHA02_29890 [Methylobacterium haplocladii]GJD85516.1 hypothetical protein HPGCJGGD_3405 [Methylobacterium haplocladii]GLS57750.1 hypothetical protein GCM10007887_04060 [Methylobacterium haplocladii]
MRDDAEQAINRAEAVFVLIDPAYAGRLRYVEITKETALRLVLADAPGRELRLDWADTALYLLPPLG